jgi:hypothetical protein
MRLFCSHRIIAAPPCRDVAAERPDRVALRAILKERVEFILAPRDHGFAESAAAWSIVAPRHTPARTGVRVAKKGAGGEQRRAI